MNKTARILFAAWLVIAGSAGSPTPCAANTAVTIKPDSEVTRVAVKLSDLFDGVPTEIDRDVAQAPLPCRPAVYNEIVLNKLADTYRLDWTPQGQADHVTITSACTRITGDMIRDAVVAKIKADSSFAGKERNFDVAFDIHNLEVDLPVQNKADFNLENFVYDAGAKQFRADFTAQTPRGPYVVPMTGKVTVKRNVPVLARRLEGGTTISNSDIAWIEVAEERVTADVVTEPSQLIGRQVRRDMGENDLLRSRDVMPARLVQRGTLITMRIETPFITVTAQGKAEQDGAEGDTVRVLNTQSNRVVEGIVVGTDTVEIKSAQKIALAE